MSEKSAFKGSIEDGDVGAVQRDLLLFKAQMSEQANRFEDMVDILKELCQKYNDLSVDERNLLSCGYKNVIGSRRTSWKILNELLIEDPSRASEQGRLREDFDTKLVKSVLSDIETELKKHCNDIITILDDRLIPAVTNTGETGVFYFKMKGDYMRYLCETCSGLKRKEKANESLLAYKIASDRAIIELPPTHPVRLGLMLNFSVFYHEIMKSPERSCRLAKQAFDDAIAELDTLSEESYRDSTIIMQLLRDNLNLWQSEQTIQPSGNPIQQQQPALNIHKSLNSASINNGAGSNDNNND